MAQVNINGVWRSVVTQASSNAFLEMLGGVSCKFSGAYSLGSTGMAGQVFHTQTITLTKGASQVVGTFSGAYSLGTSSIALQDYAPQNLNFK